MRRFAFLPLSDLTVYIQNESNRLHTEQINTKIGTRLKLFTFCKSQVIHFGLSVRVVALGCKAFSLQKTVVE